MDDNEQTLNNRFWTPDMILLAALNIVLVGGIFFGLLLIYTVFSVPVTAWINQTFGL
jgi:hypothetical protein